MLHVSSFEAFCFEISQQWLCKKHSTKCMFAIRCAKEQSKSNGFSFLPSLSPQVSSRYQNHPFSRSHQALAPSLRLGPGPTHPHVLGPKSAGLGGIPHLLVESLQLHTGTGAAYACACVHVGGLVGGKDLTCGL